MTTQLTIQMQMLLHEVAIEALGGLSRARAAGDKTGVDLFSSIYANTMQDLTMPHIEKAIDTYLTDEQVSEVFNADMRVDSKGNLISTPEKP
jgi:hypothetical protein